MMRTAARRLWISVAILASIVACQATPEPRTMTPVVSIAPGATSAASTQPAETEAASTALDTPVAPTEASNLGELSWIFDIPAELVNVDIVLETDNTVETIIPLEGGTLSATGTDGTLYTLDVPPNALFQATTISMTPISSVAGMPFGGERTYAVQFGPEGLFFYTDAILTIVPAEPIPLDEQIVFGFQADGSDPIPAAPVVDSSDIKVLVQHFSGNGVTKGLLADLEPARERVGGSAERRLASAVSEQLIRNRQQANSGGQDDSVTIYGAALEQHEREVVRPRVAAAGESCAAGQVAIQSVLSLERMRQLLGLSEGGDALAAYPGLVDKAAQTCVLEEFELCVEEHVIHRMLPVWLGFERASQLAPGMGPSAAVLAEARDLTTVCLTFELEVESTGIMNSPGFEYETEVFSEITLRFNPDDFTISGEAPLVNVDVEFTMERCDVTSLRGDGDFRVFRLIPQDVPDAGLGQVTDFVLTYMPGNTTESATSICDTGFGRGPGPTIGPYPAWTSTFMVTHADDLQTAAPDTGPALDGSAFEPPVGTAFIRTDWEIFGDEYFARSEWSATVETLTETGNFKLYHRPSR